MKYILVSILFLLAIIGHVVVQADNVGVRKSAKNPTAKVNKLPHDVNDKKFKSVKKEKNAGIGVGKLHQHQLSKPGSPKLTKLDENKKGKHRVPNQTKREHISKRTKQHGKNVGPPKQQKQPAGKMKFSKKLPESKSGLISFLCSILTMFNLKNLILIKNFFYAFCATDSSTITKISTQTTTKTTTDGTNKATTTPVSPISPSQAASSVQPSTQNTGLPTITNGVQSSMASTASQSIVSSTSSSQSSVVSSTSSSQSSVVSSISTSQSSVVSSSSTTTDVASSSSQTSQSSSNEVASTTAELTTEMTTNSTTTAVPTTTLDPRYQYFTYVDNAPVTAIYCDPYPIMMVSAFYGNSTCGPYDITANLTAATSEGIQRLYIVGNSSNFGNLCPNTQNKLTATYYCGPNVTEHVASLWAFLPGYRFVKSCSGSTFSLNSEGYVQPSCNISSIPEMVTACHLQGSCTYLFDSSATNGTQNPPGCRNGFDGMYGRINFQCVA